MSLVNIIEKIHVLAYMTQPGTGHSMPSGKISLPSKKKVMNEDEATMLWNLLFKTKTNEPVGTNEPVDTYRGPHNDREFRREPHQTIKNVIPPRGVKR
jgi:hypothetical protein